MMRVLSAEILDNIAFDAPEAVRSFLQGSGNFFDNENRSMQSLVVDLKSRINNFGSVLRCYYPVVTGETTTRVCEPFAITPSDGGDTPVIRDACDGRVIGACV